MASYEMVGLVHSEDEKKEIEPIFTDKAGK